MKDIKCPHCGTTFQVDDSAYAAILEQVRIGEFQKEIRRRVDELKEQFKSKEETVKTLAEKSFEQRLSEKDLEMERLRNEIIRLQGAIDGADASRKSDLNALEASKAKEFFAAVSEKDKEIADLKAQIANSEQSLKVKILEERNAVEARVQEREKTIIELTSKIESDKHAAEKREVELREQHKLQLEDKQAEIERLRDFRLRMSTKMVGETLEQHCAALFEEAQCNGMYPNATFEKDNTVVEHSKGDFIFRDFVDGNEYVSIMFEMKNEMDATASKHRNEDFLEKLDKDRHRKGCEYAILVSMLEQESDLYNSGIVDKSHRYPKMIVIRPQFFMPVLRLISEGARKAYLERYALIKELETAKNQSMDFAKFEDKINRFRDTFGKSVEDAQKKFTAANNGIDKIIESLEKQIKALREVKANFEASGQKLMKANEIANENLTVKKLTYGIPSVRKMIEEASE